MGGVVGDAGGVFVEDGGFMVVGGGGFGVSQHVFADVCLDWSCGLLWLFAWVFSSALLFNCFAFFQFCFRPLSLLSKVQSIHMVTRS